MVDSFTLLHWDGYNKHKFDKILYHKIPYDTLICVTVPSKWDKTSTDPSPYHTVLLLVMLLCVPKELNCAKARERERD